MTPTSGIERTFIDAMPEWTFRLFRPVLLAVTRVFSPGIVMPQQSAQTGIILDWKSRLNSLSHQRGGKSLLTTDNKVWAAWRKRFLRTARNWITTSLTRSSSRFGSISAECHYQAAQAAFFTPLRSIPALPGRSGDSCPSVQKTIKDLLTGHVRSIFETG